MECFPFLKEAYVQGCSGVLFYIKKYIIRIDREAFVTRLVSITCQFKSTRVRVFNARVRVVEYVIRVVCTFFVSTFQKKVVYLSQIFRTNGNEEEFEDSVHGG